MTEIKHEKLQISAGSADISILTFNKISFDLRFTLFLTGPPITVQADVQIVYLGGFQEVDMVCNYLFYNNWIISHTPIGYFLLSI